MAKKLMTTQELCDAIYSFVFNAQKPLSRRDIAEGIGKHKSPHIIAMIEHLADEGYFQKESRPDKFGRDGFVYSTSGKRNHKACVDI